MILRLPQYSFIFLDALLHSCHRHHYLKFPAFFLKKLKFPEQIDSKCQELWWFLTGSFSFLEAFSSLPTSLTISWLPKTMYFPTNWRPGSCLQIHPREKIFKHHHQMYIAGCLVTVRLFPTPSWSINFGDTSKTNPKTIDQGKISRPTPVVTSQHQGHSSLTSELNWRARKYFSKLVQGR